MAPHTLVSFLKRLRDPNDDTFRHLQVNNSVGDGIDQHVLMRASARLAFYYSLQFTCELQPSDGSGQCRGTTWPKERTSSQLHSSSFHGQMNVQSGKSPPTARHTSFSRLNSNKCVIYGQIMAELRSPDILY